MYRNHADQTFFEIRSEDLENDAFFYRFLIFPPSIDLRDLFGDMRCTRGVKCFHTDLRKEVDFSKSMIRDFKHFFRTPIFQFQHVGLCTAIMRIKLFSKSNLRIWRMTDFFYRFLRFRLRIDPRDLYEEMRCTRCEECFQYRIEEGSQFFEIDDS